VRTILAEALISHARATDFVFLTGDVGFMALESLRDVAKERFINAGIAEQNMVSVAAGLAGAGLRPWVYSIAPFIYARAFEQIRNDVCLHNLPVFLVGNGGGYAYGAMGPTHHAIEDYGALLGLPNLSVYVPAFGADVPHAVSRLMSAARPAYLRLGRDERPEGFALPPYAPWRKLLSGRGATLLLVGPLAGAVLGAARSESESLRPNLWVLSELPIVAQEIPSAFIDDFQRSGHLVVVEEHVSQGSAGAALAHALLSAQTAPRRFTHRFALGYPTGHTGSQRYHRQECGLDAPSVLRLSSGAS
jgi:transketolase